MIYSFICGILLRDSITNVHLQMSRVQKVIIYRHK